MGGGQAAPALPKATEGTNGPPVDRDRPLVYLAVTDPVPLPKRFGPFSNDPSGMQANRIVDLWEPWREGQHHEVFGTAFRHRSKTGDGKSALTSSV